MKHYRIKPERLPHQKRYIRSKAFIKALVTGFGGGKTFGGALDIIKHSYIDNGIAHMAVSPSFPMAKKTVIPEIIDTLEQKFDPPLVHRKDYTYNKTDHVFKINAWNGTIFVGSGDNPDSLKGVNLGSAWIDEPGLQDEMVYNIMMSRIRDPKAKLLQLGLTGTPEGLNWFFDICEGEKVPSNFDFIRGKTTDNTHLPQSFIDNLYEQYDEQLVQAYLEGLFVNLLSGSAYYAYHNEESIIDEYIPDLGRPLLVGMDFNYDPMTSVIAQEVWREDKLYVIVFDEFYLRNCDTDASCERITSKYGLDGKYIIHPDPTAYNKTAHGAAKTDLKLIKNSFDGYQYQFGSGAQKLIKRKDRLNAVNKGLKNAKGERKILITKNCKHLREDMRKVLMEEFLNGNYKDPMLGHISDALGYMIARRYPVKLNMTGTGWEHVTT
jgi:hypothetical protein